MVRTSVPASNRWTANAWRLSRSRDRRHYPEFPTIPSRIDVNCSKAFTGKLWSSIGMQVNSA